MIDIAGNTSAFGQFNDAARNLAVYRPSYADNLTLDTPIHRCESPIVKKIGSDISIDDAINLNIAVRLQIAKNMKISADNRRNLWLSRRFFRALPLVTSAFGSLKTYLPALMNLNGSICFPLNRIS